MTICENCGAEVYRRTRINGKMLCPYCAWAIKDPLDFAKNFISRYEYLRKEYVKSRQELFKIRKQTKNVFSLIPPIDILKKAVIALDIEGCYKSFTEVLGAYYGIPAPKYLVQPKKVPARAIACYHSSKNEVYSKEDEIDLDTAFHEFYHALENFGIAPRVSRKKSEENAEKYAKACLKLLKEG